MSGAHEVDLPQEGGVFKVTVRHGARGIVKGHQTALHRVREGLPPHQGLTPGVEVDSSHSWLGGVGGSQESWFLGHNLGKVRRAVAEAGGKAAEGVQALAYEAVDTHSVSLGLVLGPLQGREEAAGAGDGNSHEAELA